MLVRNPARKKKLFEIVSFPYETYLTMMNGSALKSANKLEGHTLYVYNMCFSLMK